MADSREEQQAVSILSRMGNGKIEVDFEKLTGILRQPKIQDKPLCIVSISGAFRKGKSFMINFFMRYLRKKGYDNPSWMGDEDTPLDGGFEWRGGRNACTNGILMWREAFLVKKNGIEVAILLMDTQGLFDNRTDHKTNTLIFALSTLISSVQIFNLTQHIQENDLGFLQFFTAYAQAARKECSEDASAPFQSLVFLVRDWPYGEETGYGMKSGKDYLEEVLSCDKASNSEITAVRKHLKSSFDETKCCLMPYPGTSVAATMGFRGCLKDIDPAFLRQINLFVASLFKPENLVVKKINGQVVTATTLLGYVIDCSQEMTSGRLPTPKTMMEHTAEAQNFEAQRSSGEGYISAMREAIGESFIEDSLLQDMHLQASSRALEEFREKTRFGKEKTRKRHREYLVTIIDREFGRVKRINDTRKMEAESVMHSLIEGFVASYENEMKQDTEGEGFFEDDKLMEMHAKHADEIFDLFAVEENVCLQLKEEYFTKMQERIGRSFDKFKSENDQKRLIAEQQNETKRFLMKATLDCSIHYREEMRKLLDKYTEEKELRRNHDSVKKSTMEQFDLKVLDSEKNMDDEMISEYREDCWSKLDKEFEEMEVINAEKKESLAKALEKQRSQMYVEYDEMFTSLLKDSYMDPTDLSVKHKEVVDHLLNRTRTSIGDKLFTVPIYGEHVDTAKKELDEKYPMVEKWNEENNTFLKKFTKFVRKVGDATGLSNLISSIKNWF